jgi:ribonuclease D
VLQDLRPLAPFFASEEIEKIFHGSDYDLIVLQRDYQFTCGKLFDTMWAARTLGWPQVGLGNILENYFGVHPIKNFNATTGAAAP